MIELNIKINTHLCIPALHIPQKITTYGCVGVQRIYRWDFSATSPAKSQEGLGECDAIPPPPPHKDPLHVRCQFQTVSYSNWKGKPFTAEPSFLFLQFVIIILAATLSTPFFRFYSPLQSDPFNSYSFHLPRRLQLTSKVPPHLWLLFGLTHLLSACTKSFLSPSRHSSLIPFPFQLPYFLFILTYMTLTHSSPAVV